MMDENKELNDEVDEGVNEEVNELNEKNIGGISGGGIYNMGKNTMDEGNPWVVLDDKTGNFLGFYSTKKQAHSKKLI